MDCCALLTRATRAPRQDGLRVTYHWIKGELEREAKEQGKDLRCGGGAGRPQRGRAGAGHNAGAPVCQRGRPGPAGRGL